MTSTFSSKTTITFLKDRETDTLALGEGDPSLVRFANDENVVQTGDELVADVVTDVNHLDGARMAFPLGDNTNTTQVVSTGDHAHIT